MTKFVSSAEKLYIDLIPITPVEGMVFHETITTKELSVWLGAYLFKDKFSLKYVSSTALSRKWKCQSPNCSWKLSMTKSVVTSQWKIKHHDTLKSEHLHLNCSKIAFPTKDVVQKVLFSGKFITGDINTATPANIICAAKERGYTWGRTAKKNNSSSKDSELSGYYTIRRIICDERALCVDSFDEGYSMLASYLYHLRKLNPDSIITVQTHTVGTNQAQFLRMFVMLRSQAVCAVNCKPIISYDGGFLKVIRFVI
jgi:hypothetical protein